MDIRFPLLFAFYAIVLPGQGAPASSGQPPVEISFDWECAQPEHFDAQALAALVASDMGPEDSGVASWGDRAFRFDLDGVAPPESFVPLRCGATGNCSWGLYSLDPPAQIGKLEGARIYVLARAGPSRQLEAFSSMGSGDGVVTQYILNNGSLQHASSRQLAGDELEEYLTAMGEPTCSGE